MPFGAAHWPYIIILLVIVLIIWGPGKLPDLGAGMGKAIREFKKASADIRDNVVNSTAEPSSQPPAPTPLATPAPTDVTPPATTADTKEEQKTTA